MKFLSALCLSFGLIQASYAVSSDMTPENIENNMKKVAEWQVANPKKHNHLDWTYGAFYAGMSAYGNMNPDSIAFPTIRKMGEEKNWGLLLSNKPFHADNHCIGQTWIEIGTFDKNSAPIKTTRAALDKVIEHNAQVPLEFGKPQHQERWNWADALFMAPTVFVKMAGYTGDDKYLKFMDREYKFTYDFLFDKKAGLFFRDSRYFNQKTATNKQMFWSRGNGWVIAGLPIILRDLPQDWPTRNFYETLFKQMAAAMKNAQQPDGSWYPSLHDPTDPAIKEMSATNFINYALIWGINNGYLPEKEYFPCVKKAWEVTCGAISDDGALGWVQPIADKPGNYTESSTEVYASGAFLLMGAELRKYVIRKEHKGLKSLTVENPTFSFRPSETITVSWPKLKMNADKLRVFDVRNGRVINHQIVDTDNDGAPDSLLFQGDLFAKSTREFWIFESDTLPAARNEVVCYSRVVPERMDDMSWENDVTAHRIYGPTVSEPAPKGEGLVSGGTDIWCKKVKTLVLDKFYKAGNYHEDHGEGLDWYKVGSGPGCGGIAFFNNGKLYPTRNWQTARNLYNGPIRTAFEVTYAPLEIGNGVKVTEKRLVTLDAGSLMTRSESSFTIEGDAKNLLVGVGLDGSKNKSEASAVETRSETKNNDIWAYCERNTWITDAKNGSMGTAILVGDNSTTKIEQLTESRIDGDYYIQVPLKKDKKFIRYSGAVWDKAGWITDSILWQKYCSAYAMNLSNPIKVKDSSTGAKNKK